MPSITGWDVSSVTRMDQLFKGRNFNQNIGIWDTGEVELMRETFMNNTVFDQDISSWDVSNVDLSTDFDTNTNVNWTSAEKPTF